MKLTLKHLGTVFALSGVSGLAQGIFVYDQQSSDESLQGESFAVLQTQAPGQSFTPSLASIGFIRFDLFDINNNNGKGAVVYVNVRTNSITGPILATSVPVSLPDGFAVHGGGFTNFYLATPLALTPGTTYYFDLGVQAGADLWGVRGLIMGSDYAGGTAYINGLPSLDDLWFREGIVVPEPSSTGLLTAALILWLQRGQWRRVRRRAKAVL